MRSKLIPAVLAASLAFGGAVFAATSDATGTIKALDAKAMTVTLADGTVYYFGAAVKLDGFKVGEKVMISWNMMANKHDGTAIKAE